MVSRLCRAQPLGSIRLAGPDDVPAIMGLLNKSMSLNFRITGPSDLNYLLTNCVLTICQLDINGTVVGALALKDHPLVPSVNPAAWEDFVWTKYKYVELSSRNTLFLHLLCWNPIYARDLVDNLLKSVFMHDPYLQYIAMMRSIIEHPLLVPGQSRAEASFRRVQAMERGVPGDQLPTLLIADRVEVSPRLKIRRAVEADNDDIVPIIEQHSVRLRQMYGEFYVSELIARHPESERALLVCEHKEVAVGVMCLNTEINFEELEESFDLSPFAGLRRLEHVVKPSEKPVVESTVSLLETKDDAKKISVISAISRETKPRVTWVYDEDEFSKFNQEVRPRPSQPGSFSQLDVLNLFIDEPEEMDYDIVNIDPDFMKVPKYFYEELGDSQEETSKTRRRESFYDNKYLDKDIGKTKSEFPITSPAKPPQPTRFVGPPNAFLLELFAMRHDYDERYGFDMLEVAFELFPDRDYCIVCLPTNHTCFPLLEHFTLVTPFNYQMRFINETLYVVHINSVRGDVRVRPAELYDANCIQDILENTPRKNEILDLFHDSFEIPTLSSFSLLSQNQPIGLVILGPLDSTTIIRAQYDLDPEPFKYGTDAAVLAGIMSPIMEPHSRWYLRDLIRFTKYTTLFYAHRLFGKGEASPGRHLMSLSSYMKPVLPRQFFPNVKGNEDLEMIYKPMATPFALWTLERPLTSMPKVYVNNSIVVVGASRTGLSFIEALVMGTSAQYLTFTNITLVSEDGLPTVPDCLKAAEICVPSDGRYTDRYIKSIPFYYYVDVMSGLMVKIDRKKKCIHLKDGGIKFYDELVLVCGHQFQHPDYLKPPNIDTARVNGPVKFCDRLLMDDVKYQPDRVPPPPELPENVMLINSLYQANCCLRKLVHLIKETENQDNCLSEENRIIVYGDCAEAYTTIAALLELGINAKKIAFVEPFPPENSRKLRVNCFNNETIDHRVQLSLNNLNIQVYRNTYLYGWMQNKDRVETIRLISPLTALHLPCFTLFYYGLKAIDVYAFKAINECGLVYDGGLVVGPNFDTNDPHVFAAGPCARYSRKLYANNRLHQYYTSENVGEAMAGLFLRKLDPFMTGVHEVEPSAFVSRFSSSLLAYRDSHASVASALRLSMSAIKGRWLPVLKFDAPITQSAILPGPLYYLVLRKPGPVVPMAVQMTLPHQGHILITDKNENYFRLHVNALHTIESITCLSKRRFSSETFIMLYGRHESYFNNLLARFQLNLIKDFYDFFTKPWMSAMYQESFRGLMADIEDDGVKTVHDVLMTKYNEFLEGHDDLSSCKATRSGDTLKDCGQNAWLRHEADVFWRSIGGEHIVSSHLAAYMRRNSVTNPQYAMPDAEFI